MFGCVNNDAASNHMSPLGPHDPACTALLGFPDGRASPNASPLTAPPALSPTLAPSGELGDNRVTWAGFVSLRYRIVAVVGITPALLCLCVSCAHGSLCMVNPFHDILALCFGSGAECM